jgi:hypothetical protein
VGPAQSRAPENRSVRKGTERSINVMAATAPQESYHALPPLSNTAG